MRIFQTGLLIVMVATKVIAVTAMAGVGHKRAKVVGAVVKVSLRQVVVRTHHLITVEVEAARTREAVDGEFKIHGSETNSWQC